MEFSKLLEQMREARQISKKELAYRSALTPGYISLLTRGERISPSEITVKALADALNLEGEARRYFFEAAGYQTIVPSMQPLTQSDYVPLPGNKDMYKHNLRIDDGGEAPSVEGFFYGRREELSSLEQWLVHDHCRLITVLGIGGMGKTALVAKLVTATNVEFDYVFWRSLQSAPPLKHILERCIPFFSDQQKVDLPPSEDEQLTVLISYLRQHRCLLVLDNFESVLQPGERTGKYREGYEGYGKLLQRLGETEHRSCLLLTTREKPQEIPRLEGKTFPVRSMQLPGMSLSEAREVLKDEGIFGSDDVWRAFIRLYAGNPLAMKLVSASIRELFGGNIAWFLNEGEAVFGDIQDLLEQQFARLSEQEQRIMYWLAIEGEAVSLNKLREDIVPLISKRALQEAMDSLRRRSIIEIVEGGGHFTLQPAVTQFVTDRFVKVICKEIDEQKLNIFHSLALLQGQAKDYIRDGQMRLILTPITEHVLTLYGKEGTEHRVREMLLSLHNAHPILPGYAVGNIINLLVQLKIDLRGYDFSHLPVHQAYLQGVSLVEVNFAGSDLAKTVFTDNFGSILSVALSIEGELLAVGTANGEIRLWSIASGTSLLTYQGHSDGIRSISFSRDGRMLASGSDDHTVRLWDVRSGDCLQTLQGHSGWVWSVAFSPEGDILVSGSEDQTIRLWDIGSGSCLNSLQGHQNRVYSVAFSPNGDMLASGGEDQAICLWEVSSGKRITVLNGCNSWVWSVAFSPNGSLLASGSDDHMVRLWDVKTGQCLRELREHSYRVRSVAFSPDTDMLASGSEDQTVRLWDVKTGQCFRVLKGHSSRVRSVAFSDKHLLASGSDDQTVRLWDVKTGQCLRTLEGFTHRIKSVAYSPNGEIVVSGGEDQIIRLWEVKTGRILRELPGHHSWVRSLAFSPDGYTLASGSEDQTVRLWNVETGKCVKTISAHTHRVKSVAFSADARILASASEDYTVRLWEVSSGQCLHELYGHTGRVWSVAFSPGGEIVISGSDDHTIRFWNAKTGEYIKKVQEGDGRVYTVAFNHDGKLLASGGEDQNIYLWDTATGQCLKTLKGHRDAVYAVAFSYDGRLLASSGEDQNVYLWDTTSGQCLKTLKGHRDAVYAVAFSYDGNFLISGSDDGITRRWNTETGQCVNMLSSDRPYERMNIAGVTGLTLVQKDILLELGAIEE